MKKFLSTTMGRILIGIIVATLIVDISIAAVVLVKMNETNEATTVVLQENSETSVHMRDSTNDETSDESDRAEITQEESIQATTVGISETTQESEETSEPIETTTETEDLSEEE